MLRRSTLLCASILLVGASSEAQVLQGGRLPQLPDTLGPNGGLKIECIFGCGSGGGVGADVNVTNLNIPVAQSGTWDMSVNNFPNAFQVSNFPAVQTVSVNNFPATQAVTGTFWQATQPVSGTFWSAFANAPSSTRLSDGTNFYNALTDTQLRASAVPVSLTSTTITGSVAVTGTFWQATQPVSGTVSINAIPAGTNNIGDVDVLTLPSLPAGSNAIGSITNTSFGISGAIPAGTNNIGDVDVLTLPALPAGNNNIGDVDIASYPTITKGTQGTTGVNVQQLKDSGRTAISLYANGVASGTTGTETLITLTQSIGTGATSSAASRTITNGKTFRITSVTVGSRGNATATTQITTFNLRLNTGGACVVGSTPILMGVATATPATASAWDRAQLTLPDGYEIVGNGTVALCISANAVFVTNAPTWFVNIVGFEY